MRGLQGGWQGGRMRAYAAPGAVVAERGTASEAQDYGEWGLYTIILCSMLYLFIKISAPQTRERAPHHSC